MNKEKKGLFGVILALLGIYFLFSPPIKEYQVIIQMFAIVILGVGIYWVTHYG